VEELPALSEEDGQMRLPAFEQEEE